MKRAFLAGIIAIAVLLGGSLAILLVLTRPGPMPAPTTRLDATADAPAAQPMADASDPPAASGPAGRPYGTRKAFAGLPSTAPAADRVTRKAIRKALRAERLQSGLARCVDQSGGFGDVPAGERVPRARPASLALEIEVGADELRIADAQVQDWGGASEASVACARAVLVGQVVPAPSRRWPRPEHVWMSFSLRPRSDAVASSR